MALLRTSLRETVCSACSVSWGCTWCSESFSCSRWRGRLGTVQRQAQQVDAHMPRKDGSACVGRDFMLAMLWFCLAAMTIIGYVLLDGFDLGAGIVRLFVTRTEGETSQVLRSIGPVWDGNEVWLVAVGGALFFAFPALYASAFSGFYLSLMIVLWLLILRGVSIEFRSHMDSAQWQQFWSTVFGFASAALALVFGMALGNVVRGVPLDQSGYFFLPLWTTFSPAGEVGIFDWYTLLVGVASLLALAVHGSLWVVLKT